MAKKRLPGDLRFKNAGPRQRAEAALKMARPGPWGGYGAVPPETETCTRRFRADVFLLRSENFVASRPGSGREKELKKQHSLLLALL